MGGGWSDKTKLILISTLLEVVVEVEVELGNVIIWLIFNKISCDHENFLQRKLIDLQGLS